MDTFENMRIVDETETEAESGVPNPSGKLKIHSVTGFGQHYVVPVISRYRERFPDVRIELTLAQRVPDLIEEGYDVSLLQGADVADCGLLSQRVGSAHSILCASREYVERHGSPTSLAELQQHACLELQSPLAPHAKWHFDGPDGEELAVPGRIVFSVNLSDAMAVALCRGMGVGILPIADALPHLRTDKLVHLLREYSTQQVQYFAVYPPRHSFNTMLKTWIQFLREQLPDLPVARNAWMKDLPS
ncbi:Transcriptional regulator, LysR family (plasmid) [Paraburkholderia caribensis MBA4]|uniref:Transcriptional regulator, LysR family n=1 Tax=Paraburkholderia caribensis MBA4 TaxID=1323664 RepID=A0A0P0RRR7_9BURK|nr:substrate binding domain-containing protein [Paraburkholderia caribensis]ALL71764.1 Transcriptional regulator, LysR family [Paraburkholderia caribensis MBA4]